MTPCKKHTLGTGFRNKKSTRMPSMTSVLELGCSVPPKFESDYKQRFRNSQANPSRGGAERSPGFYGGKHDKRNDKKNQRKPTVIPDRRAERDGVLAARRATVSLACSYILFEAKKKKDPPSVLSLCSPMQLAHHHLLALPQMPSGTAPLDQRRPMTLISRVHTLLIQTLSFLPSTPSTLSSSTPSHQHRRAGFRQKSSSFWAMPTALLPMSLPRMSERRRASARLQITALLGSPAR